MDRTPAWVGIYKFVVEGRPLDEIFRFMEGHRGLRPKATVTLLYNRVLPRLAPERCMNDPFSALFHRCAEGTIDPYYEQARAGLTIANPDDAHDVYAQPGVPARRAFTELDTTPMIVTVPRTPRVHHRDELTPDHDTPDQPECRV